MHIVVCIKQVPKVEDIRFDPGTNNLDRTSCEAILNPPCKHAIEAAVAIKENREDCSISVLTMGPPQAAEVLREALAMGCDEAYLLSDRKFAGADTLATSEVLAAAIRKLGKFDLIVCGSHSIDADTGQVGPQLAEKLDIPQITYVSQIEVNLGSNWQYQRETEEGYQTIEAGFPLLITVVDTINTPRYASALSIMRAAKKQITTWTNEDLHIPEDKVGMAGSPTSVTRLFADQKSREVNMLEGDLDRQVQQLAQILKG